MIALISRLLHQATIKGKVIKSNQFREVRSDSFFCALCGHFPFDCGFAARAIADNDAGWRDAIAKLAVKSLAGCSKRSRGEAREKSTSGGVHRQYVDARRSSATKPMGLFQQPACYWPMRLASSAGDAMARDTGIINALMITSPQMAAE